MKQRHLQHSILAQTAFREYDVDKREQINTAIFFKEEYVWRQHLHSREIPDKFQLGGGERDDVGMQICTS